jgi:hypothetical protein
MHTAALRLNHREIFRLPRHFFTSLLIFCTAYFVTISVNAQQPPQAAASAPADVIQLKDNGPTVVTGTVTEAEDRHVVIDSAGTLMHIDLEEVELKGDAGAIFKIGMDVTVEGKMTGNDFGMPIIKASSITAREIPAAAQ